MIISESFFWWYWYIFAKDLGRISFQKLKPNLNLRLNMTHKSNLGFVIKYDTCTRKLIGGMEVGKCLPFLQWSCGGTTSRYLLKQYYEMSWEKKNFTFHFFSSYIYVMTLVVTVL